VSVLNNLVIKRGTYPNARRACEEWHYSRTLPSGVVAIYDAYEHGRFIGSVIFGRGVNHRMGIPLGLERREVLELVRVALAPHAAPVSRIASKSVKMLKADHSEVRALLSYSDPLRGHYGGIYQAMNWIYDGVGSRYYEILIDGKPVHPRAISSRYGTAAISRLQEMGVNAERGRIWSKFRYWYPLDRKIRKVILKRAKPYPQTGR